MSVKGEKSCPQRTSKKGSRSTRALRFSNKISFHIPKVHRSISISLAGFFLFLAFQQFKLLYLPGSPYSCNP